ncbi:MAG: hypothetical protein LBI84_05015, partial [Propionibacteriaceae bacterium]|nr:hypothetical protein [Propionibacteriaceae bacterium]
MTTARGAVTAPEAPLAGLGPIYPASVSPAFPAARPSDRLDAPSLPAAGPRLPIPPPPPAGPRAPVCPLSAAASRAAPAS